MGSNTGAWEGGPLPDWGARWHQNIPAFLEKPSVPRCFTSQALKPNTVTMSASKGRRPRPGRSGRCTWFTVPPLV